MCADIVLDDINNKLELSSLWKFFNRDIKFDLRSDFTSYFKSGFNNLMYGIGVFTYLNEGWNGLVYSFVTVSSIFLIAPYSYIVIAGGLLLGILDGLSVGASLG